MTLYKSLLASQDSPEGGGDVAIPDTELWALWNSTAIVSRTHGGALVIISVGLQGDNIGIRLAESSEVGGMFVSPCTVIALFVNHAIDPEE